MYVSNGYVKPLGLNQISLYLINQVYLEIPIKEFFLAFTNYTGYQIMNIPSVILKNGLKRILLMGSLSEQAWIEENI